MSEVPTATTTPPGHAPQQQTDDMVWIPGGRFTMGSDHHYPEEAPTHPVSVDGFWIDPHPVTNAQFQAFVEATGYRTTAERPADPSTYPGADPAMLAPASAVFTPPSHPVDLRYPYQWWSYVPGADWRHPGGPGTSLRDRLDHPVTHVAWPDALAYAQWAGKQIPTEAEWEYAARGGLPDSEFAWGDELNPGGRYLANTWQGEFPHENLELDGYAGTSPVGAFPANDYGLYDMIGNVWEWTSDWYADHRHLATNTPTCCGAPRPRVNPAGGEEADSVEPGQLQLRIPRKVMKGGSHLCAPNYCRRYRPAARLPQPIDTSTCHLGFRCLVRPAALPPRQGSVMNELDL
ncbi:formylglycine-generating enzyme family protein [Streptomyces sp. NBC_01799]|uniref:formylglycine-generating enzyme family protein n=1 Tax=Streptomyces sp. NBC_01800 TaxID=2975945 RepID=UPI002DD9BE36|nr:formylglycine-generating enzyme family protein [Streptomyces sp. NBC_01800]WSA72563.1 formylglycine-generating enzyme family protein [Streptomyces sp. NBC_01800]WSA81088.1 formylglycine-generating enzyme family protein [Streptomyces sp. NBC_01799]